MTADEKLLQERIALVEAQVAKSSSPEAIRDHLWMRWVAPVQARIAAKSEAKL